LGYLALLVGRWTEIVQEVELEVVDESRIDLALASRRAIHRVDRAVEHEARGCHHMTSGPDRRRTAGKEVGVDRTQPHLIVQGTHHESPQGELTPVREERADTEVGIDAGHA